MNAPAALTGTVERKQWTLCIQSVISTEEQRRLNLCKLLKELGLIDGQELAVADITTPDCTV
jgi:ubiquitin-activating enzyme E1 C